MNKQKRGYEHIRARVESYLRPVFDDPAGTDVVPSMRAFQRATGTSPNTLKHHGLHREFARAVDLVSSTRRTKLSKKDRKIQTLKSKLNMAEKQRDAALLQVATILEAVEQHSSLEAWQVVQHVIEKPFRDVPRTAADTGANVSIRTLMEVYGI